MACWISLLPPRGALQLSRNLGPRWSDETANAGLALVAAGLTADIQSVAFGDLDRDGDLDAPCSARKRRASLLAQPGRQHQSRIQVRLVGRVSNRGGVGSKVELRAGSLRQRLETSAATPALGPPEAIFGLGARPSADVVRVIWPSGTLQAETGDGTATLTVTELDRKPSSCPYLYTWNGSRFEFVTDFMGGGEIGYWMGPGVWNTPDPDEYVRIPPGRLQPRGSRYELRVTNELEEAVFVDHLQLVAIDHQRGRRRVSERGARRAACGRSPANHACAVCARSCPPSTNTATTSSTRLTTLDRQYVDGFRPIDIRGYAEPHDLSFDLGPGAPDVVLLATGWTDYAFSGDNVAAHQRGLKLEPPVLEARSPTGAWRTIENIGIPVGRPQTVVVDLRGKLRPGERELRILTNMRIYWDQILVDRSGGDAVTRMTRLDPVDAELRWRGFSAEVSPDGRQPFTYDYDRVTSRVAVEDDDRPLHARRRRPRAADGDRRHVRHLEAGRRDRAVVRRCGVARHWHPASDERSCCTPTDSAKRWTSPRRARTRSSRCHSMGCDAILMDRTSDTPATRRARGIPGPLQYADRFESVAAFDERQTDAVVVVVRGSARHGPRARPRPDHVLCETMMTLRYAAAACQTDLPNPLDRRQMAANTDRMLAMIDAAVAGSAPFLPVRLVVFPEFAHAAPVFPSRARADGPPRRADPQRAHRTPAAEGARARDLHPERLDDRARSALAGRRVQHHVPDRPGGHPDEVSQGQHLDPVRGPREPARPRPGTTSRCSRSPTRQSAASVARSVTTGCFPKRSASSPPTARRC